MKKAMLFASLLALTLSVSAQSRQSVSSTGIPSNAHQGRNAIGPVAVHKASASAAVVTEPPIKIVPPTAKVPPTAVNTKNRK